jgi:periplasmic copper chaperone A
MKPRHAQRIAMAALALITFGLASCGDGDNSSSNTSSNVDVQGELTISGQWARTSPATATTGAAYMTITSPIDDVLLTASVDESIATSVELHEMVMMGDHSMDMNDMDHSSMSGEMKMQQVMEIPLAAGKAVELKPGGLHVMFIGLVNPLQTGDTISLTLTFKSAGDVTISVPVSEDAP